MTDHRHSGEPETPQTEAGRDLAESMTHNATDDAIALGSPISPERVLDLLAYHQSLVVAVEREAAAAPGAGLDVERLAKRLREWITAVVRERFGHNADADDLLNQLLVGVEAATHSGQPETPQAGWVERLTALLHETRQHRGPPCDLCLTTANGFRRQAEREAAAAPGAGLDAISERVTALAHWDKARWADMRGADPIARTLNAVLDILYEYQRLGATPGPGPEPRE